MTTPLREVRTIGFGTVTRRTRDGHTYKGSGVFENLECGHVFVPFDNNRMGGQDEAKPRGKRRCAECAQRKDPTHGR